MDKIGNFPEYRRACRRAGLIAVEYAVAAAELQTGKKGEGKKVAKARRANAIERNNRSRPQTAVFFAARRKH